jgi:hypothetical protein
MAFDFSQVNEKLGKLPIWGWGLIIGGGIAGVYYFKKPSVAVPTTTDSSATATTSDNAGVTGYSGSPEAYSPYSYVTPTPSVGGGDINTPTPDNAYTTTTPSVGAGFLVPAPTDNLGNFTGTPVSKLPETNAATPGAVTTDTGSGSSNAGQTMPVYDPTQFGTTGGYSTNATPTTSTGNAAMSLDAWRAMAISKANQNSSLSMVYSANAIDKYLAGLPLDQTQANQVQKALGALGNAPGTSLTVKIAQAAAAAATTPKAAATSAPAKAVAPQAPKVMAV